MLNPTGLLLDYEPKIVPLVTATEFSIIATNNLWSREYSNMKVELPSKLSAGSALSSIIFPPKVNIKQMSRIDRE